MIIHFVIVAKKQTPLTDVSEMALLLSVELGYDLSLQVGGKSLVQPKLLPRPVGH